MSHCGCVSLLDPCPRLSGALQWHLEKKVVACPTIFTPDPRKHSENFTYLAYHTAMAKPNKQGGKPPAKPNKGTKRGPSFNENALEQLTSKIDQNLNGNDHKRKKPPTHDVSSQDRKRQRNSSNGPPKSAPKGEKDSLLDEIRALGGDEEDLKLIGDIDSSDEELVMDDKKPVDKSLKDELAAFSKQLGFSNYQPSEASEEEQDRAEKDEEDDDDFEDVEDGEEGDEDEEDEDEVEAPRKVGNLVSRLDYQAACLTC